MCRDQNQTIEKLKEDSSKRWNRERDSKTVYFSIYNIHIFMTIKMSKHERNVCFYFSYYFHFIRKLRRVKTKQNPRRWSFFRSDCTCVIASEDVVTSTQRIHWVYLVLWMCERACSYFVFFRSLKSVWSILAAQCVQFNTNTCIN